MPRTQEQTAALAVQLHEHLQNCTLCWIPIDWKQWDGVILCPLIREWLDLHFPEDRRDRQGPLASDPPQAESNPSLQEKT